MEKDSEQQAKSTGSKRRSHRSLMKIRIRRSVTFDQDWAMGQYRNVPADHQLLAEGAMGSLRKIQGFGPTRQCAAHDLRTRIGMTVNPTEIRIQTDVRCAPSCPVVRSTLAAILPA